MPKQGPLSVKAGPLAHRIALGCLSELVRQDPDFMQARRSILERFPWLNDLEMDTASGFFRLLRQQIGKTRLPENLEELMGEVARLAARYSYDRITDGEPFMVHMIVTGEVPRLREFGYDADFIWNPTVLITPDDTFDGALRRIRKGFGKVWEQVVVAREATGRTEHLPLEELYFRVEWYFTHKIKRIPLRDMVGAGLSESTIRRGMRQVQHLLGIPPDRPGRPPKLVNAPDRN